MSQLFVNNSAPTGLFPDGLVRLQTLTVEEAKNLLANSDFVHGGNPDHWPTWHAIAAAIGNEKLKEAKGGRLALKEGDKIFVAEVTGLPRETREFTPEEIAKAKFRLRLATVVEEQK